MTTKRAQSVRAILLDWLSGSGIATRVQSALGPEYQVILSSVGGRSEIGTLRVEGPDGTVDYFHLSAVRSKT